MDLYFAILCANDSPNPLPFLASYMHIYRQILVKMWQNQGGKSVGLLPGRETLGPLALMATTPFFIFILWYTMQHLDGNIMTLIANFKEVGPAQVRP